MGLIARLRRWWIRREITGQIGYVGAQLSLERAAGNMARVDRLERIVRDLERERDAVS